MKKSGEKVWWFKKSPYLCNRKTEIKRSAKDIGVWCNGNTTDSGPVIPGSNPGTPTQIKTNRLSYKRLVFLYLQCCTTDSRYVLVGAQYLAP